MLKVLFNKQNALHTCAMLLLAIAGAAGLTTTNAGDFFASGAATLTTFKGVGAILLLRAADQFKNGTLIAQLTANGKLTWRSVFTWLQAALIAAGVGQGVLNPDLLTNIHSISIMTIVFAVVSTAKNLYTHYVANVSTDNPVIKAATSASL
jgi:hypothetical protein